jgi:hypothetical protein
LIPNKLEKRHHFSVEDWKSGSMEVPFKLTFQTITSSLPDFQSSTLKK